MARGFVDSLVIRARFETPPEASAETSPGSRMPLSPQPRVLAALTLALILSACAGQIDAGVSQTSGTPGFLSGLWHGFIFPWSFIGSLFSPGIAVYSVPNNGGWYDFGFFLGVTVLGGGSFFGSRSKR